MNRRARIVWYTYQWRDYSRQRYLHQHSRCWGPGYGASRSSCRQQSSQLWPWYQQRERHLPENEMSKNQTEFTLTCSTYIEDNTANGSTGLGVALLMLRVSLGSQSCIADAIIVVKATKGDLLQIVQLNHYYRAFLFYDYFLWLRWFVKSLNFNEIEGSQEN